MSRNSVKAIYHTEYGSITCWFDTEIEANEWVDGMRENSVLGRQRTELHRFEVTRVRAARLPLLGWLLDLFGGGK
jgi:hypothetical protein